jgi:putative hemolysin
MELAVAIPIALACVVVSGFCSGSEVALFSLRRVDREQLARSERGVDRRITSMLGSPRRLIATVLIGNEALNSVVAVVAFAAALVLWPTVSPWAIAGVVLAATLALVVLVTEVTMKTLAAKAPLGWARACAYPLAAFGIIVAPVRILIQTIAAVLLRPLGEAVRPRPTRDLSEEEFRKLVDAGSAQGQVDARERRLIHRVFEFSDKNVGQVMTPRDRIFALSYDLPMQRLVKEIATRGFSRVPIYQKSLDNIRGTINAKDLVRGLGRPLVEVMHDPLFVPRTTPIKRLFLTFKQKKVHMAIVVSEYGKVLGLVTMDDLLGQIFGVLRDERTDLQASMPNIRIRARTPAPGVPISQADLRSGPVQPIHPTDEVTPPAADVEELVRSGDKN